MKLRIISDLHLSINSKYPIKLNKDNCDYTLIAGDLGPDYKNNVEWIRNNVKCGAFISGNHDAYTHDNTPIEDVKEFYHKNFPLDGEVTYFDSDVGVISKEIGENILLVADVLYTDYKFRALPSMKGKKMEQVISQNMFLASPKMSGTYMNDFCFFTRNGKYEKNPNRSSFERCPEGLWYIRPENYKEHFDRTFKVIDRIVKDNPDKDIILMTHHCLSKKCISPYYSKDTLNASYISDKDSWIRKHPNIKLIVSGHVHHRSDFMVGKTLYVLNPLGYIRDGQHKSWDKTQNRYVGWTPDCIVDTKDWSLTYTEFDMKEWDEIQKVKRNSSLDLSLFFV